MSSYDDWLTRSPAEDDVECEHCGSTWRGIMVVEPCHESTCTANLCEDCRIRCEGCGKFFCDEHTIRIDNLPLCSGCAVKESEQTDTWIDVALLGGAA